MKMIEVTQLPKIEFHLLVSNTALMMCHRVEHLRQVQLAIALLRPAWPLRQALQQLLRYQLMHAHLLLHRLVLEVLVLVEATSVPYVAILELHAVVAAFVVTLDRGEATSVEAEVISVEVEVVSVAVCLSAVVEEARLLVLASAEVRHLDLRQASTAVKVSTETVNILLQHLLALEEVEHHHWVREARLSRKLHRQGQAATRRRLHIQEVNDSALTVLQFQTLVTAETIQPLRLVLARHALRPFHLRQLGQLLQTATCHTEHSPICRSWWKAVRNASHSLITHG